MNEQQLAVVKQALEAHQAMREWIDAVPDDTVLPAMPGCDRDWLDTVEAELKQALAAQPASVHALRSAIANDAWAISFQSLGQYRSALLKLIDTEQASQEKG
jgi:hypothetical protein